MSDGAYDLVIEQINIFLVFNFCLLLLDNKLKFSIATVWFGFW